MRHAATIGRMVLDTPHRPQHLVTNIASHVKAGVKPEVMPRVIEYWASVHPDLSAQAATQLTGS